MKKIIKLTEQDLSNIISHILRRRSLNEALTDADDFGGNIDDINTEISSFNKMASVDQKQNMIDIQKKLKELGYFLGVTGKNKDGVDGKYGNLTLNAIKKFQKANGIKATGWVGTVTAPKLGVLPMKGVKFVSKKVTPKKNDNQTKNRCIAISKEECAKINPNSEVRISSGRETRCSAYMVKCLSQYDEELYGGNAWDVLRNVKSNGKEKYNSFTNGEVNWDQIWIELSKSKISKSICEKHAKKDDADKIVRSAVPTIVTKSIPTTSGVDINSLQLGDIVGLYHKNSANKGMAFCQRVLKKGLDENGNVKNKEPFTFNSHVGFVGAIKNGIPIIIHNVHGTHLATPATKMLNKNSDDMIVWVVSDNDVSSAINRQNYKTDFVAP